MNLRPRRDSAAVMGTLVAALVGGGPVGRARGRSLGYDLDERWRLQGGYRTVEGGADVSEVYTFAWLHSAVLGVEWRR